MIDSIDLVVESKNEKYVVYFYQLNFSGLINVSIKKIYNRKRLIIAVNKNCEVDKFLYKYFLCKFVISLLLFKTIRCTIGR